MLPAFQAHLRQGQVLTLWHIMLRPMQLIGIPGCFTLLKNGQLLIAQRQGCVTSSSPISIQTMKWQVTLLVGGVWVLHFYHGLWYSFGADSLNTIPNTCTDSLGLSSHSRLSHTLQTCLLKHVAHWLKAVQQADTRNIWGTADTEECLLQQTYECPGWGREVLSDYYECPWRWGPQRRWPCKFFSLVQLISYVF